MSDGRKTARRLLLDWYPELGRLDSRPQPPRICEGGEEYELDENGEWVKIEDGIPVRERGGAGAPPLDV